ncbi:2-dehydro-3-deoxy-6-phosphogalactonate aldolase [Mesorhizobium xinjiangense]|uniref:2-dehydro-3-deoxy-6-phosphogalactonate aldolase n=1 Tax=Mesorhizobium xinjiangense TaxID=2678685 RepID=UPI0012EDB70A|nr:2-dehydro-3-deoxy-6-phosphogalactonate aldolase [Mesorhizobium xinjiangense]
MNRIEWPFLSRGLVAILRGVRPDEVVGIAEAIVEAGIGAIEVPLNSPDPFRSIEALRMAMPDDVLVGAGTVLEQADVDRLIDAGGRLMVSPNIDADVMRRSVERGMVTMPGVFTPSEALLAVRLGASALKFFPAATLQPAGISAIRAVLPAGTVIGAVGGIGADDFDLFQDAGVSVFGLGSSLYKAGLDAAEVGRRARAAVEAWDRLTNKQRG